MSRLTLLRRPVLLLAVIGLLATPACSRGDGEEATPAATTLPAVTVTSTPAADATGAPAEQPMAVVATNGTIVSVSVTSLEGPVQGTRSPDGTTWTATTSLRPSTTYQVRAQLVDPAGQTSTKDWTFGTADPTELFRATISPVDDRVVGVGMPVVVKLTTPIPEERHAELVKQLTVTTTPTQPGAWRWFSDTELHWRPAEYWKAGTKVRVDAAIDGFHAADGVWGMKDVSVSYSIGDANVSVVDTATHTMTVSHNGAVVKTIPVSTGRDKYPTKGGIHVASDKAQKVIMDSATVGIPRDSADGYYETVYWNVRISNSGEFVHAAPWSVGSQGRANVSHGCVNASTADAQWFYEFSQVGDVVQVLNSPEQLEPTNGIGDWQIPWAQWAN